MHRVGSTLPGRVKRPAILFGLAFLNALPARSEFGRESPARRQPRPVLGKPGHRHSQSRQRRVPLDQCDGCAAGREDRRRGPFDPGDRGLLLARYLPDGSLDSSLGDEGYVETHTGDWAFASAATRYKGPATPGSSPGSWAATIASFLLSPARRSRRQALPSTTRTVAAVALRSVSPRGSLVDG